MRPYREWHPFTLHITHIGHHDNKRVFKYVLYECTSYSDSVNYTRRVYTDDDVISLILLSSSSLLYNTHTHTHTGPGRISHLHGVMLYITRLEATDGTSAHVMSSHTRVRTCVHRVSVPYTCPSARTRVRVYRVYRIDARGTVPTDPATLYRRVRRSDAF